MIEAIFEGARARCRRHSHILLSPTEQECEECILIRRNMSLKPPFSVVCKRTHFGVEKDKVYKVIWLIRDGAKEFSENMYGYVFSRTGGGLDDTIYAPTEFVPIDFLSEEEREKLGLIPDPPKEEKKEDFTDWEYACG